MSYHIKGHDRRKHKKEVQSHMIPSLLMAGSCQCYKEFKPGMAIPVKDIKTLECAKCGRPLKLK